MASTSQPPAQPAYILRGHTAQINALHFWRQNTRLATGDADGWIVIWDMVLRRPVVVWKAHGSSILTLKTWGAERLISHGRDSAIRVWNIPMSDEATFSTALPTEGVTIPRKQPWLLHSMTVNTLNFCSFSICPVNSPISSDGSPAPILLAVTGTREGHTDIFQLPTEKREHAVPPSTAVKPSMLMALHLLSTRQLISAGESGATTIQAYDETHKYWTTVYSAELHSQPILSLSVAPEIGRYFTSGADAVIAMHPLPSTHRSATVVEGILPTSATPAKELSGNQSISTGHSGQQSLTVRSDERVFATAGWDGRIRVYSAKTLAELAVLKWHKEGCYAVTFAEVFDATKNDARQRSEKATDLTSTEEQPSPSSHARVNETEEALDAEKKTRTEQGTGEEASNSALVNANVTDLGIASALPTSVVTVKQRREQKTKETHWLAAGSKDGKVSLWVIY